MERMNEADNLTAQSLAVAVVAISKSLATLVPSFSKNLTQTLSSAEKAGLADKDLALLRMMVASARNSKLKF